jgi:hypothetical protein
MGRRILNEMERHASAIRLLQCIDKFAVAIFEVLMDDFDLALELDLRGSRFPLSCGGCVNAACV